MKRKALILIVCISVVITCLGLSANAFTYNGIKGAVEGVTASVDTISVDVAYFELLGHAFRGFFSGETNHFALYTDNIFADDITGEWYGIVETLPPDNELHTPYFARIYLGTIDFQTASDTWRKITSPFSAMSDVANWNTGELPILSNIADVAQIVAFVLASVWCLISCVVQVVFDVFGVAYSLIRGMFRIVGIAPSA